MIVLYRILYQKRQYFFRHNDPNPSNMMMDRDDFTFESLILIDWDLTQYGYRSCSNGPCRCQMLATKSADDQLDLN